MIAASLLPFGQPIAQRAALSYPQTTSISHFEFQVSAFAAHFPLERDVLHGLARSGFGLRLSTWHSGSLLLWV